MNYLQITLTPFKNESRLLKESKSIVNFKVAKTVFIASLHEGKLLETEQYSPNLKVKRFKLRSRGLSKNLFGQIVKYFEFLIQLFIFYNRKEIKIVHIHSLALLPIGLMMKVRFKAKLIYDAHELETEKNGLVGFRQILSRWLELIFIKYADLVIVVSENIALWYKKAYKIQNVIVIYNAPIFLELKSNNLFRNNFNFRESSLVVLYQGVLAKGRGVELLINAFNNRDNDDFVLVFMGYGELTGLVVENTINNNKIFYQPAVSPDVVLDYTASADIGISLIENVCLSYYFCMPNKVFEYAMAGIPVIVSNMIEMKNMVLNYEMGVVLDYLDEKNINSALDNIKNLDLNIIKENSKKCAKDHSWQKQETKLIDALNKILND